MQRGSNKMTNSKPKTHFISKKLTLLWKCIIPPLILSSPWPSNPSPLSFSSSSLRLQIPILPSPESARSTSPTSWTTCSTTRRTTRGENGARNPNPLSLPPISPSSIPRRSSRRWWSATPDPWSDSSSSGQGLAGLRWGHCCYFRWDNYPVPNSPFVEFYFF